MPSLLRITQSAEWIIISLLYYTSSMLTLPFVSWEFFSTKFSKSHKHSVQRETNNRQATCISLFQCPSKLLAPPFHDIHITHCSTPAVGVSSMCKGLRLQYTCINSRPIWTSPNSERVKVHRNGGSVHQKVKTFDPAYPDDTLPHAKRNFQQIIIPKRKLTTVIRRT